jgi:hypothetical protein
MGLAQPVQVLVVCAWGRVGLKDRADRCKGKWKEKIKAIMTQLIDAIKKVRKGEYIPDRENDELTLALRNAENVGRIRALLGVTMKEAWLFEKEEAGLR